MRKAVLPLVIALALPLCAPLAPTPASARIWTDIAINGVSARQVREWHENDPLSRERLMWRLKKLRGLIVFPLLKKKDRRHISSLIAAYERRLSAPALGEDERAARALLRRWSGPPLTGVPGRRLRTLRLRITDLLASPELAPPTRRRLALLRRDIDLEIEARTTPRLDPDEAAARALLSRRRNLRAMPTPRLMALGRRVVSLLGAPGVERATRRRLAALRNAIQAEMRRRTSATSLSPDERAARALLSRRHNLRAMALPALRRLKRRTLELLASPDLQRPTRRRLAALRDAVIDEIGTRASRPLSAAERRARDILARITNLPDMGDDELRWVHSEVLDLLSRPGLSPATRRRLATARPRLEKELGTRRAASKARRLLHDSRPPRSLSTDELRARLRRIRATLRDPLVPRRLVRRLRAMLARDRAELRRRIARAEGWGAADEAILSTDALLRDARPPESLSTPALRARIRSLRRALTLRGLSQWRRGVLARKLAADRAELRARLLRARAERRARLAREGRIRIGARPAPAPSITAAEADRRAIERQLAAAPRFSPGQRFTLRELRARPELRDFMPAVDLDSIHFGFNEYWIREEEVDKLERIGEAIERIIATNPREIFLIEGHTDAVGSFDYNQRLSEKRARAVKQALVEYFNIPADNLVTIGYGERFLKIPVPDAEPENRRVVIRRITPLLRR